MSQRPDPLSRSANFCAAYGLKMPVLLAPMAGSCPPSLSIAVMQAGGMGACGALLMQPDTIAQWANDVRAATAGPFQLNLWVPDPAPQRNDAVEAAVRAFLRAWGPEVQASAGNTVPPDFSAQCEAMLAMRPSVISSIMGLFAPAYVERARAQGVRWFANATTVAEARAAEAAGADAIVAQGMEAGGHRGAFEAGRAEVAAVGLFALLPAIVDAVKVPVIATGGIADARGIAAALLLGASAVQIGTGFLRSPEAKLATAWADAIGRAQPEDTLLTRAFSGRLGRSLATAYARAATSAAAPAPAPYPVQRGLTQAMRDQGTKSNDLDRMQAWAGQSARLAPPLPAGTIVQTLWAQAQSLLQR